MTFNVCSIFLLNLMLRCAFGLVFTLAVTAVTPVLGLAALAGVVALAAVTFSLCIIPSLLQLSFYVGETCCSGISAAAGSLFYNRENGEDREDDRSPAYTRDDSQQPVSDTSKFRPSYASLKFDGGIKLN